MRPGRIRQERVYAHPPEHVWRALTDRELLARWLMPNDFEPRLGHRFTFQTEAGPGFDGIVHCEVLEIEEPVRLVLSWRGGPLDTRLSFTLKPEGEGTRLLLEHTGFEGLKARLVGRLLSLGNRTLYGKRLPQLLDEMARDLGAMPPSPGSCMEKEQGILIRILGLWQRRTR